MSKLHDAGSRDGERGVAIVLVVVVLAAIIAVAAPFLLSMRMQKRTADGFNAEVRARLGATAARELAVLHLMRTSPDAERALATTQAQLGQSPEDWDDLGELLPTLTDLRGETTFRVRDPNGALLDVRVEDEQGKIHLGSAPSGVLGNLLGVTVLLEAVTEETEELIVEDMLPFFSDDNPETLDGILLIDGEIIAYAHWVQDMNPDTQSVFYRVQGLLRGAFLSAPRRRDLQHPAGRLVRDARGVKLALHPYWLRLGRYSPFATVAAIRDIASWSLVDPFVASLFRRGYTAQDLHDLGLGGDALESFGATSSLRRARQRAEAANAAEAESEEGEGTDAPEVNLPKKLDPSRAGNIAERVMRAHGRQGGADWLKAVRARTDAKGEALEEFLAAAEKEMNARAEYEESYFSSAADRLSALGSVRDIQVLGAREAGRIKPHLTVHSTRPMEWAGGAIIRNRLEPDPKADQSTLVIGVLVPEARAGAVAKVVGAGGEIEYRQIRGVNRPRKQISLYPQLSGTFGADSARVFCAPAHPVNVNTASREVLRAVFTGVTLAAGRGRQDLVTPREAERLAERVIAQPIEGPEAFRIVLAEAAGAGEISGTDAQALFLNAIDPGHPRLRGRTLPFTFASGGVFTIETTSVVNNPAGVELAREVVREVVSVAPARTAEVYFDSQQDMLYGGNSRLGPVHIPGRRGNLVELSPVPLRTSQLVQWPERSHQPGTGRMRLETGETGSGQGSGVLHVEHYRDELRGQDLGGGMSLDTIPRMDDPYGSWPSEVMAPGWIELWMRPQGSGPFTVFDTGQRDTTDRLVLHYDGQRFIFEAYDASIEPIPCAELQGVVELRAGTWYHIAASWRGTRPGDLALFLDGVKLGSTFDYDNNGRADAPGTAYLTSGIDQNALSIPVDNTAGFPPQGAIRVGTEVIEYDGVSGNSFTVRQDPFPTPLQPGQNAPPPMGRGARGSSARAHGVRTPVTIFGYSNFFVGTIPGAPFSLAQVQRGGATLTHALPALTPMAALQPDGGPQDLVLESETSIPTVPSGPSLAARGFPPRGFLHIHHELLYYDRLTDYTFEDCVRVVAGRVQDDANALIPPPNPPLPEAGYLSFTPVFLASIEVSDASQYEDLDLPLVPAGNPLRGFWLAIDGPTPQQKEWMRYYKANALTNPQTGGHDPRWDNILLVCDSPPRFNGGGNNSISAQPQRQTRIRPGQPPPPINDEFPRADGWQPGRQARWAALEARWLQVSGGMVPPEFRLNHFHVGMEWGRNLFRPDTQALDHTAGARVLPAYALTRAYSGALDRVTIMDASAAQPQRAELTVWETQENPNLLGANLRGIVRFTLCVFEDFIPNRPYDPAQGLRLIKRPSGLLPLVAPTSLTLGAPRQGGEEPTTLTSRFSGRIDELKISLDELNRGLSHPGEARLALSQPGQPAVQVLPETVPVVPRLRQPYLHQARTGMVTTLGGFLASEQSVGVGAGWQQAADGLNQTGVAGLIGDEIIGLTGFNESTGRATPVRRGLLGTETRRHAGSSPFYVLPFPPAVRVDGPLREGGILPITGVHPGLSHLAPRGYLMVDNRGGGGVRELMNYEEVKKDHLRQPLDDRRRGVYRAAFGTDRGELERGTLGFAFPFRHFDRFAQDAESDEAAFWQASFEPPGASAARSCLFRRVTWDENVPNGDVDVVVLARIDGVPAWDTEPENRPGSLYRFDNPRGDNVIDAAGRQIEVRVVFPFRPGSYRRGSWKASPSVDGVRIRYITPVAVLQSEESS